VDPPETAPLKMAESWNTWPVANPAAWEFGALHMLPRTASDFPIPAIS
jgi:hypothetical protein